MIVLGIDPGTAITGYGLIVCEGPDSMGGDELGLIDYGVITTPAEWPLPRRLLHIHQELTALIQKHRPTDAVVEKLFFSKNVRTALSVGQARGVALLAAAQAGLTVHEYTPLEIKQAVVGYGRAEKRQIQQMVQVLLQLDFVPQPDDAADALAVAICRAHSARLERLKGE
ncbi:MAG: crossover junction endodeoxyribonuclease RuvC [Chloroflexi bacterium]|nr:crossover junction endodeoxyribonuclease RuvC [Chloroflexota bacterium]